MGNRSSIFSLGPYVRSTLRPSCSPCKTAMLSWWRRCMRLTVVRNSGRNSWLSTRKRLRDFEIRWDGDPELFLNALTPPPHNGIWMEKFTKKKRKMWIISFKWHWLTSFELNGLAEVVGQNTSENLCMGINLTFLITTLSSSVVAWVIYNTKVWTLHSTSKWSSFRMACLILLLTFIPSWEHNCWLASTVWPWNQFHA